MSAEYRLDGMLAEHECIKHIEESVTALNNLNTGDIVKATELVIRTLKSGGKIMLCGNGGSAADAQHIAAELMGRYKVNRNPLPAIALTTDTSALTAIANDYGYDFVFKRQLQGIAKPGDCLIGISTSGNSLNVRLALAWAIRNDIKTIGLTGAREGLDAMFESQCNICIKVPSTDTPIIQQCHITIGHIICALVEGSLQGE